ncbi:hypothetical protein AVEN_184325-1, partial [Araneus ventricosus]
MQGGARPVQTLFRAHFRDDLVVYLKEDKDVAKVPPEVLSYEVPLRPALPETTTSTTTPTPRGNYRTPIRVQVGRVVRVQNGATPANT